MGFLSHKFSNVTLPPPRLIFSLMLVSLVVASISYTADLTADPSAGEWNPMRGFVPFCGGEGRGIFFFKGGKEVCSILWVMGEGGSI